MTDIQIIEVDQVTRRVTLRLRPRTVAGVFELVQVVVLSLLNIPGKDVLDPETGGGLPALIGQNIDPTNPTEIFAEIAQRVRKTQQEVIARQVGLDLTLDAKLKEIQILDIAEGGQIDEILVRLRVVSESGRSADIVL